MTWRDDLPDIPSDRIRRASVAEGGRRIAARRQRQRNLVGGGLTVLAVGGLATLLAIAGGGSDDGDDTAGEDTAATEETIAAAVTEPAGTEAEGTDAPATTSGGAEETTAGTEAPAGTEAAGTTAGTTATTSATEATAAEGTLPDYTTIPDVRPINRDVSVAPEEIFEQPGPGVATCGGRPIELVVRYAPPLGAQEPVVRWEVAGDTGETPMDVDGDVATATLGPFAADTLADGTAHEVLVLVVQQTTAGEIVARAPTVVLRDCP